MLQNVMSTFLRTFEITISSQIFNLTKLKTNLCYIFINICLSFFRKMFYHFNGLMTFIKLFTDTARRGTNNI